MLRVLTKPDFAALYRREWSNALCEKRKELDMLAVGAFDGEKLIGLAGCSADCSAMWQIGVDVLPEYRQRGVASAVTARLASETFGRGKLPFYCAAWSNIRSVRNALRCGFFPAWAELTVKSVSFGPGNARGKAVILYPGRGVSRVLSDFPAIFFVPFIFIR